MAVLILTKLGQRWLPGKLRGTTLIPEDVKLITVPGACCISGYRGDLAV